MIFHNNVGFFRDFNFLLVQYGIAVNYVESGTATLSDNGYSNIQNSPLCIPRSDYFRGGSFSAQASYGYLWSCTTYSGTNAYHLSYNSSNVHPAGSNTRQFGFPVRCITRDFNFLLVQYGIAVNYVGSSNATWSNNGYSNIQNNPLYIPRSGYFNGGSFGSQSSLGYLWSGSTYSGTLAYLLLYSNSNVYPAYSSNRQYGFPVRCIAR